MNTIRNVHGCEFHRGEVIDTVLVSVEGKKDPVKREIRKIGPCKRCAAYRRERNALIPKALDEATLKGELLDRMFLRVMDRLWEERQREKGDET